jgi:hypothetical protein
MSWFDGKKAPDGVNLVRHRGIEPRFGITDQPDTECRRTRQAAYQRLFGKALSVSHKLIPQIPQVDGFTSRRSRGEQIVYSWVTGGMSDLEMTLPQRAPSEAPRRAELIFYCSEPSAEHINTLPWVAHFPHNSKSFLGYGHTMPSGNPPAPFWGSAVLDTLLFLPPIVTKDPTLPAELKLGGQPVHFLWLVPLTGAQCDFKLQDGLEGLMNLFRQHRHPYVFDPQRNSYA